MRATGAEADPEQVLVALEERDRRDSGRKPAPLKPAHDAVLVEDQDVSHEIRTERISQLSSKLSAVPEVRGALLALHGASARAAAS